MRNIILIVLICLFCLCFVGCISGKLTTSNKVPITDTENLTGIIKSTNLLFIAGVVGLALGIASVVNGSKSATAWVVASAILIGVALTVAKYAGLMALICLIGGVGWFVYSLFIKKGFLTFNFMEGSKDVKKS